MRLWTWPGIICILYLRTQNVGRTHLPKIADKEWSGLAWRSLWQPSPAKHPQGTPPWDEVTSYTAVIWASDVCTALEWAWVRIALPTGAPLMAEICPLGDGDRDMGVDLSPWPVFSHPHSGGSQVLFNGAWWFCALLSTKAAVACQKATPSLFLIAPFPNSSCFSHLIPITGFWSVTPKIS